MDMCKALDAKPREYQAHMLPWLKKPPKTYAGGIMLVGDAAGFPCPLEAEGVWHAVTSGRIAAETAAWAISKGDVSEKALAEYERRWKSSDLGKEHEFGPEFVDLWNSSIFDPKAMAEQVQLLLEVSMLHPFSIVFDWGDAHMDCFNQHLGHLLELAPQFAEFGSTYVAPLARGIWPDNIKKILLAVKPQGPAGAQALGRELLQAGGEGFEGSASLAGPGHQAGRAVNARGLRREEEIDGRDQVRLLRSGQAGRRREHGGFHPVRPGEVQRLRPLLSGLLLQPLGGEGAPGQAGRPLPAALPGVRGLRGGMRARGHRLLLSQGRDRRRHRIRLDDMTPRPSKMDVHHHVAPPEYVSVLAGRGISEVGGRPFDEWSTEEHLSLMDRHGIAKAMLSVSAPGVYFGDVGLARELARSCNEFLAGLARSHPERFGAFAVLPLPDVDAALEELAYAMDTLKLDGVSLTSSVDRRYMGDPAFDDLFDELDRRRAVVFMHPHTPEENVVPGLDLPASLIEFVFETTRAVGKLLFSGTMERCPDVRIILPHAGGTVPYITLRLCLGQFWPGLQEQVPQGVVPYLQRFYYDTALSAAPYALRSLEELVDVSHILFGSDYPFAPELATTATVAGPGGLLRLPPGRSRGDIPG